MESSDYKKPLFCGINNCIKQYIKHTLLIILFCAAGYALLQGTSTNQASAVPGDYELIWSDEFSGSSLDTSKWGYQTGGWNGSNVQNCYVAANVTVDGGSLNIYGKYEPGYSCGGSGTKDFTSGFVQTQNKVSWTYGYFEARMKLPASNSTWPAFWMSPQTSTYGSWPQSGEIDVMEAKGYDKTKMYSNAIWGNSSADRQQQKGTYVVGDFTAWHTYGVEWSEGSLKYYVDGVHFHTVNNFDEPNATTHPGPFNIPFYLRLNMAIGGDYLQSPNNDAHNNIAQLPALMQVDWVHVYKKTSSTPATPPASAPSTPTSPSSPASSAPQSTSQPTTDTNPTPSATNSGEEPLPQANTTEDEVAAQNEQASLTKQVANSKKQKGPVTLAAIGITTVVLLGGAGLFAKMQLSRGYR